MRIEKKCDREYFNKILNGEKKFEVRLADEKFKEGDILVLREWDNRLKEYTGRTMEKEITYVLKTVDLKFFSEEDIDKYGYIILSLK